MVVGDHRKGISRDRLEREAGFEPARRQEGALGEVRIGQHGEQGLGRPATTREIDDSSVPSSHDRSKLGSDTVFVKK